MVADGQLKKIKKKISGGGPTVVIVAVNNYLPLAYKVMNSPFINLFVYLVSPSVNPPITQLTAGRRPYY